MTPRPLPFFALGSSYYPPHHAEADWERDLQRMVDAGLQVIRTAELLATWDWIERQPGQPDWSWLDRIFELANRYGLRIILGTGSCNPPIWMTEVYPDLPVQSRDGVLYPTATVWGWACKEHPGYRAEVERYLTGLLERYHQQPALLSWQIDNEPGFPLIPRGGQPHIDHYCYCPHHTRGFREWLQNKYSDIEALNTAWRWDPTHHYYYDWHLINPPRSMPSEWGGVTHWLDWRTYQYDALARFLRWQDNLIKSLDTVHPTYTNIFCWSGQEVLMGMDGWRLAQTGDAIGYDVYPSIGRRSFEQPEYLSMYLDTGASQARQAGVGFWLPEVESGPLMGWALGPDHDTTGLDLKRFNLEAIAHGAKMILYQGYREWNCIPVHWGALVDFSGEPTARYHAAASVNQMVAENQALLMEAYPVPARVAILDDPDNHAVLFGMEAYSHLLLCVRGCYQALWSQGYRVDFVSPAGLTGDVRYNVIFLPFTMLMTAETGRRLRDFVANGGTLVGFAKCAMLDERGWSWNDRPGAGLAEAFGVSETSIQRQDTIELLPEAGQLSGSAGAVPGYWHKQNLRVAPGAVVLAHFADGGPALVSNRFGQGRTFYAATHLDAAAIVHPRRADMVRAVFRHIAQAAGVEPVCEISGKGAPLLPLRVDAHRLHAPAGDVVVITNNAPEPVALHVRLPGVAWPRLARELFSGELVPVISNGDSATFDLNLPAWDGTALAFLP